MKIMHKTCHLGNLQPSTTTRTPPPWQTLCLTYLRHCTDSTQCRLWWCWPNWSLLCWMWSTAAMRRTRFCHSSRPSCTTCFLIWRTTGKLCSFRHPSGWGGILMTVFVTGTQYVFKLIFFSTDETKLFVDCFINSSVGIEIRMSWWWWWR